MYKHVFKDGFSYELDHTISVAECRALEEEHGPLKYVLKKN